MREEFSSFYIYFVDFFSFLWDANVIRVQVLSIGGAYVEQTVQEWSMVLLWFGIDDDDADIELLIFPFINFSMWGSSSSVSAALKRALEESFCACQRINNNIIAYLYNSIIPCLMDMFPYCLEWTQKIMMFIFPRYHISQLLSMKICPFFLWPIYFGFCIYFATGIKLCSCSGKYYHSCIHIWIYLDKYYLNIYYIHSFICNNFRCTAKNIATVEMIN